MIRFKLLLMLLLGCEQVEGYIDDGRSTVYICDGINPAGDTNEWCYFGSAEELEELTGATGCHATLPWERTSIIGCWWHCDGAPGCNAHNSCAGCEP